MAPAPVADTAERVRRAQQLFEQALELGEAGRTLLLDQACGEDQDLRQRVEGLLRSLEHARTDGLFPSLGLRSQLPRDAEESEVEELPAGRRIGRHLVLERAGEGGFGTVYAAYDTLLGRKIALKVLSAAPADPSVTTRLVAEATAMAGVNHPNVVTVHDVGEVDGVPFVAMEYVSGATLAQWRGERPRSTREILTVMASVARGLAAAHRAQVVHGDVKPSNILVDGERVLLTDFGLSVRGDTGDAVAAAGAGAGTPGYMAPEQYRGQQATPATDVFGFCATLHELLYGQRPFGGSFAEIRTRVLAGQVEPPPFRPTVPRPVRRLLRAGLAREPGDRPASMEAIAATLLAGRGHQRRRAMIGGGLAVLAIGAAFWLRAGTGRRPQVVSGPAWVQPPRAISPRFFGVTIKSQTGAMPDFRVGAVRFWDSRTRWANLEPARGQFAWKPLDRMVKGASRAGLPILFTLGGTPAWAAPSGPRAPYNDRSRAAPPDRLSDWEDFVRALTERYGDRIEAYEVWPVGNDPHFYDGPLETLVEMTRIASRIIKAAAPRAKVVCPGMGRLWTADGQRLLRRFAELGGYRPCDVANLKLHARSASEPPETMLELVGLVDSVLHATGIRPPIWSTGVNYELPLSARLDEATAVNHAARFFLVGLYGRLSRMYFYNWGGHQLPIVLQAEGGAPTAAARAVERLQGWLLSGRLRSCGRGRPIGLPDNVWQCRFSMTEDGRRHDAAIRWTDRGTARTAAGRKKATIHRLDGSVAADVMEITVSEEPIFVEWR